jgi:membrane protein YdbS with pleckstrin-like domain
VAKARTGSKTLGGGLRVEAISQQKTRPRPVKVLIALVVAWCLLVAAAVAATSTWLFEEWDIYLAGAAVIVGLAIVVAIVLLP